MADLTDRVAQRTRSAATSSAGADVNRPRTLKEAVEELERDLISQALEISPTLKDAAESLGIDISTLLRKKKKLGIEKRQR